jgi:hypothetical protein
MMLFVSHESSEPELEPELEPEPELELEPELEQEALEVSVRRRCRPTLRIRSSGERRCVFTPEDDDSLRRMTSLQSRYASVVVVFSEARMASCSSLREEAARLEEC